MKNFLTSHFVKRTGAFVLLWVLMVVLANSLSGGDASDAARALWTFSTIGIYVWKVWGNKKRLLNKIVMGIAVWLSTAIGAVLGDIVAGSSAFGLMIEAYILLVSPWFEGETKTIDMTVNQTI